VRLSAAMLFFYLPIFIYLLTSTHTFCQVSCVVHLKVVVYLSKIKPRSTGQAAESIVTLLAVAAMRPNLACLADLRACSAARSPVAP